MPADVEKQTLRGVLKAIDQKPPVSRKLHWIADLAIWVAVGVTSFVLFRKFGRTDWFQTLLPFATFGFGMFFMAIYLKAQRIAQWPIIGAYVDRSRVEARLRELGG